ncbi:aminopeptidase [Christensenellaceae bacterium OttesenSCG-928-L17]|nr:aminopeptidase [Christensenellaceae bacterium OttesenSCG-928-L17]
MKDIRLEQLAERLLHHSLRLQAGELFEINSGVLAKPLIKELLHAARRMGAFAYVRLEDDELSRLFYGQIDPSSTAAHHALNAQRAWERERWAHLAAHVDIGVDENDAELSAADTRALQFYRREMKEIRDIRIDERRWIYLHWPTMADAQKAGMCYDDFYEFFLRAALVDYPAMRTAMQPLIALMEKTEQVRIVGPGTDISFSIANMPVVPCFGERNIPDGEVYTAPVRESANGYIQYNTSLSMLGRRYENPRLVFQKGRIVEAACANDTEGFNQLLDTDEGARYLGEFALGVNNAITKPISNTLYDEKIGGSFHLTPGCAYKSAFNGNTSSLHMDIVCLQTPPYGGEIYFDGVCIRKDGRFTLEELAGLNP